MGRAEKRALGKKKNGTGSSKHDPLNAYFNAMANQKKLRDSEIDRIENELTLANVGCIFNAFAYVLREDFKATDEQIVAALQRADDIVGEVHTKFNDNITDFKVHYALELGMEIDLSDEETKIVREKLGIPLKEEES